jgi:hypothetical protein
MANHVCTVPARLCSRRSLGYSMTIRIKYTGIWAAHVSCVLNGVMGSTCELRVEWGYGQHM